MAISESAQWSDTYGGAFCSILHMFCTESAASFTHSAASFAHSAASWFSSFMDLILHCHNFSKDGFKTSQKMVCRLKVAVCSARFCITTADCCGVGKTAWLPWGGWVNKDCPSQGGCYWVEREQRMKREGFSRRRGTGGGEGLNWRGCKRRGGKGLAGSGRAARAGGGKSRAGPGTEPT
jgi:hypothetical protein